MERRTFVKKALTAGAAGGVLAGCGDAAPDTGGAPGVITRERVLWRLASSFPRSLDTIFGAAEDMAKRLESLTEGRFIVRAYPAGELVPFDQVLDSVQKGTVNMGHSASYYFIGKNPALAFDTCVPFGLTARQYNAWFQYGGGQDLMRNLFADFNIVNFQGGNTGTQMGGWFRREINSLQDLRGLTMRIPGLGGHVMSELGVNAQVIAGGEIYPALERGAIDATEWVGPYDDEKLGFHKVARYYYYPGWWEPGPALSFYVNRDAYGRLPEAYKQALEVATAEAGARMLANYDAKNPAALQRLLSEGVQLRVFPDDVMAAARQASEARLGANASDPAYRAIWEAHNRWREDSRQWFGTAELAFANFVHGNNQALATGPASPGDCTV